MTYCYMGWVRRREYRRLPLASYSQEKRRRHSGLERWPCKRKVGSSNPAAKDLSRKTGSDSSTVKRSAIGVMSRVLGDDHYKWMPRVTVGVAR